MSENSVNLLVPEQAIVERLAEKVGALKMTKRVRDIADTRKEAANKTPAALVAYDGLTPQAGAGAGDGRIAVVTVRWQVILAVRNAAGQRSGTGVRDEAGEILTDVIQALLGWKPAEGFYPLAIAEGGGNVIDSGFGYFWQPFSATTALQGIDE